MPKAKAADFFTHLPGTWHLERTISDGARFQGLAHIKTSDMKNVYGYHEEGQFLNEARQEAYRDYLYKISGRTLTILFADREREDQTYVTLDFSASLTANDTYFCGDDVYGVIFEIISLSEFHTETIVSGPAKDYRLVSQYRRL